MNECRIEKVCEGQCSECGKDRKGVRFRLGFAGDAAFFCWEHFRLLLQSLRPRVVREVVVRTVARHSCCRCCGHHCCGCSEPDRYRQGETVWQSESETVCVSRSHSESVSEGLSGGTSHVRGEGYSEARGHTDIRSASGGRSHE